MPERAVGQRVTHRDELPDNTPHRFTVNDQDILLVRIADELFALSDVCPHNGASLSEGIVKDGCVTCPAHLWRFGLADGRRQGSEVVRVATYPISVDDEGWIHVDVPAPTPRRSLRETLLASARGEDVN